MPNIKSAKKRVLVNKVKYLNNQSFKSALKTSLKKFDVAVAGGTKEEATLAFNTAVKAVDKAASKNIYHANKAARQKSSLALKLNSVK